MLLNIETFFKFIKQELNFSDFINRTKNGIESILCIMMICALILLVYKGKNELAKAKDMFSEAKSDPTYKKSAEYELGSLK